jgi:CBS domain-containing protein/uncharacterized protein (DUF2267 family)
MSSIEQFMDQKVVVLRETDSVFSAAKAMSESEVGCVVIAGRKGEVAGIITDRDIVCNAVASNLDSETPLQLVMETDLVALQSDSTVEDAIRLMEQHGIRRLPIVDLTRKNETRCIGIVSLDDLIAGEMVSAADIARVVRSQILRQRRPRGKGRPHKGRLEQSYNIFISKVAKRLSLEREVADTVVEYMASILVRRLHYSGGLQMLAQFPKILQEKLLELPAGPDRSITSEDLIQGTALRSGKRPDQAQHMTYEIWQIMKDYLGETHAEHIAHQLPEDIRDALTISHSMESQPLASGS